LEKANKRLNSTIVTQWWRWWWCWWWKWLCIST